MRGWEGGQRGALGSDKTGDVGPHLCLSPTDSMTLGKLPPSSLGKL